MRIAELLDKIKVLKPESDEQRNKLVCTLIGHSDINTTFFGYFYCARCGDQVGDNLGSVYDATSKVIVGHDCDVCRANYKKLGWEHRIFSSFPFKK